MSLKDRIALAGCGGLTFVAGMALLSSVSSVDQAKKDGDAKFQAQVTGIPKVEASAFAAPSAHVVALRQDLAANRLDAEEAASRASSCVLRVDGQDVGLPLLPTEESDDAMDEAQARGLSGAAFVNMLAKLDGFVVEQGTRCDILERHLLRSRVKILTGANSGRTGFTANEWIRADP